MRGARGHSLATTIQTLNPVLRGWAAYFKLAETKRALEELRWMDTAQVTLCPVAAVEAAVRARPQPDATGPDGGAGVALGH